MKKRATSTLLASLLFLNGCTTQPQEWKGVIESQPPISIDDKKITDNNWIWQDQVSRWLYRKKDEVLVDFSNWDYEAQALVFNFNAPQQLNMHMGKPHTLFLKVYQLSDLKVFKDIAQTPAGIRELLSSDEIDPSIISTNELTISPNTSEKMALDRFKETRFVAVVTGFYQMKAEESVRIFKIPAVANRDEELNFTFNDINPFAGDKISEPARIKAWVDLGVTKISRLQMVAL